MNFSQLFGVFSKRDKASGKVSKPLTPEFKNRVLQLCTESFPAGRSFSGTLSISPFWSELHRKLRYLHGRSFLTKAHTENAFTDVLGFLLQCSDKHFLDFVEIIFESPLLWEPLHVLHPKKHVDSVNQFFEVDELPYYLTQFVVPTDIPTRTDGVIRSVLPRSGPPEIEAYPKIVRRDSEILHETATKPTLTLLTNPMFASANEEFLDALDDFRNGDYRDCVAKCGSSFESVMKVICETKGWPSHNDAAKLLNIILPRTDVPQFLRQPLIQTATIRNQVGSSHGAGTRSRDVPKHLAQYTINVTASAILLEVAETDQ